MTERTDIVVAGAGVIGLAVARALAARGRDVFVLEAASGIGTGMSSRNSEVIHAGIYYPEGSLKARLCVRGKGLLYEYCRARRIDHRPLGKLIVAVSQDQTEKLEAIRRAAIANGVTDLVAVGPAEIAEREPALRVVGALWSPSTGIIDSHALMLAYQGDAEASGATIVCHAPIERGAITGHGVVLEVGGKAAMRLSCNLFINCAGLGAIDRARRIEGFPVAAIPTGFLCKGSYFSLGGVSPFRHLVYPVPEPGGLGVHVTLDLGGQVRFGPDVEWVEEIDYRVSPERATQFYAAIRRYWPGLPDDALRPAYSGIRAKIAGPSDPNADFRIDGPAMHGIPGIINLFGIESPGLTASLAIAEQVASIAANRA